MSTNVKPRTVKLIARFIRPLCEEGFLSVPEMNEILGNLKNLAAKGEMLPAVQPKLVDQAEAAEMLGISLANYKKMEREGRIPIPRKMVGSSVRYRNTDIIRYILSSEVEDNAPGTPMEDDGMAPEGRSQPATAI